MIFSSTWEEHLEHLKVVFKWLETANLKIKCSKCEFLKTKVHYLAFLVGIDRAQPLPEKVAAIQALQLPKDINKLRQFLGLVGFTGNSYHFFSDITICLNRILRKEATFNWTEQCKNAFKLLKAELAKMPYPQYQNFNKPFKLFTDTSKHSYSRILHQEKQGQEKADKPELIPIAYFWVPLTKHKNFGIQHKKNVMQSTSNFKKSLFILQVWSAYYIVITNP